LTDNRKLCIQAEIDPDLLHDNRLSVHDYLCRRLEKAAAEKGLIMTGPPRIKFIEEDFGYYIIGHGYYIIGQATATVRPAGPYRLVAVPWNGKD